MDWFNLTLRWYLLTTASTIALAPIAFWLCRGLVDRGASVARPIAALAMIWPIWYLAGIGSGIVPFSVAPLWVALVVIGAASWALAWRIKLVDRITIRHLLIAEAAFLVFFGLFIWFHGYGPQITDQEKPGDLMMLASSMRSTQMPPNDAWMAGETINYYYLGYVIWAAIAKMVGATPWEAFNLTLATTFGITCVGAAGLAANIAGRWLKENVARLVGLLGLLFVVFMGNPWAAFKSLDNWSSLWKLDFFAGIGWPASRVIHDVITTPPDTIISEFPAFSFILADLHPHLLTLPFAIVSLSLGWALLQGFKAGSLYTVETMSRVVLTGGIIGALYAMNSWDMPTYLVLAAIALIIATVGVAARERVVAVVVLAASAVIAWLPFYVHFTAPTKPGQTGLAKTMGDIPVVGGVLASIVSYHGSRTSAIEYLDVFGFIWVIAVVLIAAEFWNRRHAEVDPLNQKMALGAAAILILGALLIPMPVLALAGLPIVATVVLIQRDPRVTIANVALGLFSFGFLLTIIPEFYILSDIYGTRMNTIFKIYYQVWLLTGIAAALALISIWTTLKPLITFRIATSFVAVATAIVIGLGLTYPVMAGQEWLNWRNPSRDWMGINGLEYVDSTAQSYNEPGEYAAINWLWDNSKKNDVMLAASGCAWQTQIGRPSGATGIPSILGWTDHEEQWHLSDPTIVAETTQRITDVTTMFSAPPTTDLLDKYGVTLIYIGALETNGGGTGQTPSGGCAPGPFQGASNPNYPGAGWTEAYNSDGVRIYRRDGS